MGNEKIHSFINSIEENKYAEAKEALDSILQDKFNEYIDSVEETEGDN